MEEAKIEHPSPEAETKFIRLLKGVARAHENVKRLDLDLVTPPLLQTLYTHFKSINAELIAYFKNLSLPNLDSANNQLDTLAQQFPYLFFASDLECQDGFRAFIDSYHSATNSHIGAMEQKRDALVATVEGLEQHISELESGLAKSDQALSQLRQENTSIATQQNEVFIKSQQERDTEFKEVKETIQEAVDTVIADKNTEFSAKLQFFQKAGDDRIKEIESMLDKARQTFQNLGVVVQTGKYQEFADKEAKAAKWMRIGAIISLSFMFAGTLWVIFKAEQDQLSWNLFLLRFITVASLSILGYYFARESTRHRKKEHQYRRIQLELTSLTPYLEFFDEAKKKEIKEKLVNKYFGREEVEPVDDKQLLTKKDLMEIIAKIPTS